MQNGRQVSRGLSPKFCLLHFRLRTLLALPLLFAVAWWWITWPERTAKQFAAALAAPDFDTAQNVSNLPASDVFWKLTGSQKFKTDKLIFAPQSWNECLLGQRRFRIHWQTSSMRGDFREFVAARGRVLLAPSNEGEIAIAYHVTNSTPAMLVKGLQDVYRDPSSTQSGFHFAVDSQPQYIVARVPASAVDSVGELIEGLDAPQSPPESMSVHFLEGVTVEQILKQLDGVLQARETELQ